MTQPSVVSAPGMAADLQRLYGLALHLDQNGIKVVAVDWAEFFTPKIQVATRADFDATVALLDLRFNRRFGDVNRPCVEAVGVANDLHLAVFGPADA